MISNALIHIYQNLRAADFSQSMENVCSITYLAEPTVIDKPINPIRLSVKTSLTSFFSVKCEDSLGDNLYFEC